MALILMGFTWLWIINIILSLFIIYFGRKNPRSTLIWILIIELLPIVGFVLYLMFGANFKKRKMFKLKEEEDKLIESLSSLQSEMMEDGRFVYKEERSKDYHDLINMNLNTDDALFTQDNTVKMYYWGQDKFEDLLKDIENATERIDVQYYIFRYDKIGKKLVDLLEEKQREGVQVRLLYDAVGCRSLKRKNFNKLKSYGGETAEFFPAFIRWLNPRINYRNHRKMVIIDDRIGYIGGFNVGDDYMGEYKKMGLWRDTHARIEGGGVMGLKLRFLKDWYYATDLEPDLERDFNPKVSSNLAGDVSMQIVTSGPDTEFNNIKNTMIKMISQAKDEIYIQTPYLVPDLAVWEALRMAILSGVKVNIMIPNKPDHIVVYWATTSYAGELIKMGANVYTYDKGFLHAKMLLIDDYVSTIGSANMDERSFSLNFEANTVMYSRQVNSELKGQFMVDLEDSTQITEEMYENRPLYVKVREPISRLFSPIL